MKQKNETPTLYKERGFLLLEPAILMLIFYLASMLIFNGMVNIVEQSWRNAANSGAIAGAQTLLEEKGKPGAQTKAQNNAVAFAGLHEWFGNPVQAGQITFTAGTWANCLFTAGGSTPNAVKIDIGVPLDADGNPSGIASVLAALNLPMFRPLPVPTSAVAAYVEYNNKSSVVLVAYEGGPCD